MTDCTSWATATWRNLIVQALDKLQCDCCGLLFGGLWDSVVACTFYQMYRRGSKLNLCSCDFGVGVSKREGRRKHPRAYFPQPTAVWVHQFMVRLALSLLDDISWWIKWELSHTLSLVIWVFVVAYSACLICVKMGNRMLIMKVE